MIIFQIYNWFIQCGSFDMYKESLWNCYYYGKTRNQILWIFSMNQNYLVKNSWDVEFLPNISFQIRVDLDFFGSPKPTISQTNSINWSFMTKAWNIQYSSSEIVDCFRSVIIGKNCCRSICIISHGHLTLPQLWYR